MLGREALPHYQNLPAARRAAGVPPAYPLTRRPTEGGAEHPNGTSQNHSNHWEMDGEPELGWSNPDLLIRVAGLAPRRRG
jgi:hypothetical protein